MSNHVKALNHLRKASDYPARVVKQLEVQVQRDGGYGVPFDGLGKGFIPEEIGSLLVLFSSNPYELANLIGTILEKDESGKVREYLNETE